MNKVAERREAESLAAVVPVPLDVCRVDGEALLTHFASLTHQIDAEEDREKRIDLRVKREIVKAEILRRMKGSRR